MEHSQTLVRVRSVLLTFQFLCLYIEYSRLLLTSLKGLIYEFTLFVKDFGGNKTVFLSIVQLAHCLTPGSSHIALAYVLMWYVSPPTIVRISYIDLAGTITGMLWLPRGFIWVSVADSKKKQTLFSLVFFLIITIFACCHLMQLFSVQHFSLQTHLVWIEQFHVRRAVWRPCSRWGKEESHLQMATCICRSATKVLQKSHVRRRLIKISVLLARPLHHE